ncbi:LOW QUALITY PROTEIN: hypothetical protein HID58_038097, partial [Brassica napus]
AKTCAEAHPEQFPKPEPTSPKDPDKKKSLFKKKKPDPMRKCSSTRHPLRVPGMKPGEGCYICKSKTHIAKFASCFICKEHGHISKNCPQNKHGVYPMGGCCKVCGSVAHLVKDCPDKLNRDSAPTKSSNYNYISLTGFDATPRGKLTKFSTGMILRTISMKSLKKNKTSDDVITPDNVDEKRILKKKQGPTI